MTSIVHARRRLNLIASLSQGWHFGEGVAFAPKELMKINTLLNFAVKAEIAAAEVFPGVDGSIELHLYYEESSLEIKCLTDDTFCTLTERPDKSITEEEWPSIAGALNAILSLVLWSSSGSSTVTTGRTKKSATSPVHLKSTERVSQLFAGIAQSTEPTSIRRGLVIESRDFILPDHGTFSPLYGVFGQKIYQHQYSSSKARPPQEMFAITT